jgi:hypothetical protein
MFPSAAVEDALILRMNVVTASEAKRTKRRVKSPRRNDIMSQKKRKRKKI